ncbi:MAG: large conductance mechanosensitive channel protein MscL [Acidobacteriota bacterium]|nr:large conductance mechanosensitive channel protein MscL [Acidobacteriota bacterium]
MLKGFRDFILRGNVVDLAVAVVIGAAFGAVVTAFTKGILMQFIAAVVKTPDFDKLAWSVNGTPIVYGPFLTALLNFLIIAAVVYFFVVAPLQYLMARMKGPQAATTKSCPECLSEIPLAAHRCRFCAQPVS